MVQSAQSDILVLKDRCEVLSRRAKEIADSMAHLAQEYPAKWQRTCIHDLIRELLWLDAAFAIYREDSVEMDSRGTLRVAG